MASGESLEALNILVAAYHRDPGNLPLFLILGDLAGSLPQGESEAPDFVAVQEEVRRLPAPAVAPAQGAPRQSMAQTLVSLAGDSVRTRRYSAAVACLRQARRLTPEDGRIVSLLAIALSQAQQTHEASRVVQAFLEEHPTDGEANVCASWLALQRNDEPAALAHCERILKSGVTTPQQLTSHAVLGALRETPAFRSLLSRFSETQPSPAR